MSEQTDAAEGGNGGGAQVVSIADTMTARLADMNAKYFTREEVLAAPDGRRFEDVPVDEWRKGAMLRVSSLSAEMRDLLEDRLIKARDSKSQDNIRAFYVWLCAVNPDGTRMFKGLDEVEVLGRKSTVPIERIFDVTLRLNDVSDKAVEEAAKNSEGEVGATSSSPSP